MESEQQPKEEDRFKLPVITFEGKKYTFNPWQVIVFAIAVPVFVIVFYELLEYATWIRVIVGEHTIDSMNFVTLMGASIRYQVDGQVFYNYVDLVSYTGLGDIFYSYVDNIVIMFDIPGRSDIQFVTFCTGFQAIIIFAGLILFTPHSKDDDANKRIWQRKIGSLFWSSLIFYIVNIIRMWIQLYLYYIGFAWNDIHYSISAASSFIAAIIILMMHKKLPEFVICILWTGVAIKRRYFPNLGYKKPKIEDTEKEIKP